MFLLDVDRTRHEAATGAERDGNRIERIIYRTKGRRLSNFAEFRGRRILSFCKPIDSVIEQKDSQIHVATQHMDQVITTYRKSVAVPGHDPDVELWARYLETRGKRGSTTVDGMKTVGIHVVRKTAGASDTGNKHHVFPCHPQLGH